MRLQYIRFFITCLFFISLSSGSDAWKLAGLEDKNVMCVIIDYSKKIIAGTDSGLYIKAQDSKEWVEIPTVVNYARRVVEIKKGEIAVTLGNGLSKSDGVYSGKETGTSPFYSLKLIDYLDKPQSIALGENMLFAGAGNKIVYSIRDTDGGEFMEFHAVKTPEYCFGVEDPLCADMYVWKRDNKRLYAGGYGTSPMQDPGHCILSQTVDSMVVFPFFKKLNVTCFTNFFLTSTEFLYIGTRDTGILCYSPIMSSYPKVIPAPENEAINHMIAAGGGTAVQLNLLVAAVKSGVYAYRNNSWVKLGTIPAVPNYLAYLDLDTASGLNHQQKQQENTLYAGTDKGVYQLSVNALSVSSQLLPVKKQRIEARIIGKQIVVSWISQVSTETTIDVVNTAGKLVSGLGTGFYTSGEHMIFWNPGLSARGKMAGGVYFIRLREGNRMAVQKICID